jgi:hypothetical protein
MQASLAVEISPVGRFSAILDAFSTRNLQSISGLNFGHGQSISLRGIVSTAVFALSVAFPVDIRQIFLAGYIELISFEVWVEKFSVFGSRSIPLALLELCPLVGSVLSLSLGPHIPPVYPRSIPLAQPVLCPFVGSVLLLSLGPRFRSCTVKATVLRQI